METPTPYPLWPHQMVSGDEVEWQRDTSLGCSADDEGSAITDGSTSCDIVGLEEGQTSITIIMLATNTAGMSSASNIVSILLLGECDKQHNKWTFINMNCCGLPEK